MRVFHALFIAGILSLTGCAAPKQNMLPGEYDEVARMQHGITQCATTGYIDPTTAAQGLAFVSVVAKEKVYSSDILRGKVNALNGVSLSNQECNRIALLIARRQQQLGQQNAAQRADQQMLNNLFNNQPKQTYCNQIGTQTLCSTY